MSINKSVVLLCLFLSVGGCSRYSIQALDTPEGPTSALVVYKPHYVSGANAPVVVAIDGVDIALLRNNTYLETAISAGSHVISVRGFRVGLADERKVTLAENSVFRLKVDKPVSSVVKASVPIVMHLSKLYYLEEEDVLSLEDIKTRFTRVSVRAKQEEK